MRRSAYLIAWSLVALLLTAPALGLPADKHVTLEADDGQGCTSDQKVDCFRVTNGTLDGFVQGMWVHLELENVGDNAHNAYVAKGEDADENRLDTPESAAVNGTDTIDPGENTSMMFQVPEDAESLYIWCEVGSHEALGMWLNATVEEAPNGTNGTNDGNAGGNGTDGTGEDGMDDAGNGIPAPGAIVLAAAAAGAALRRRCP